jgi:hypothetical protein
VRSAYGSALHGIRSPERWDAEIDRSASRLGCRVASLPRVATRGAMQSDESGIGVEMVRGGVGDDDIGHVAGTRTLRRLLRH